MQTAPLRKPQGAARGPDARGREPGGPSNKLDRIPILQPTECPRFVLTVPDGRTWLLCTLFGRSTSQGGPFRLGFDAVPEAKLCNRRSGCLATYLGHSGQAHARPACLAQWPSQTSHRSKETGPAMASIRRGRVVGSPGEGKRGWVAFPPLQSESAKRYGVPHAGAGGAHFGRVVIVIIIAK